MATGLLAAPLEVPFGPWSCRGFPPNAFAHPDQLPRDTAGWLSAQEPAPVAATLAANQLWDFDRPVDLDGMDWWYRTTFPRPAGPWHLCFDGLATLAEVWINGRLVLTADNMFRSYRVPVGPELLPENELVLCFRSLGEELKRKRPRPRWKTALVSQQQLRWHRTSLLGRIPGWTPPVPVVGPWREVRLDTRPFTLSDQRIASRLEGDDGTVTLQVRVDSSSPPEQVTWQVGTHEDQATVETANGGWLVRAAVRVPSPQLWWPHTHGEQPLFECSLHLTRAGRRFTIPCGAVGFRHLRVRQEDGFAVEINDVPIYCRGACWTTSDVLSPGAAGESLDRDLALARDAGMNMIRVSGTMFYESDRFYRRCAESGILVWQDFPFANMDYPVDDAAFAEGIEAEARQHLSNLSVHPCLVVFCGSSEVEQQAAMRAAPRELWRNSWFATRLPELCAEYCPGSAYVPSSPSGGELPFHLRQGVSHFYGIGAYLRSARDLRQDDVRFTSECLGFANLPEPETANTVVEGGPLVLHDPRWKRRASRDTGPGWDFEDVRDFYLRHLFGVDPVHLRSFDMPRYLQLSAVVPGEMMTRAFAEWRSCHTRNTGALVWFFKDLWPGPGWGIVDSTGLPKAPYYALRRCWQTRQITLTDEGLEGLHLHLSNETAQPLEGSVELLLLKDGHIPVGRGEVPCNVPPRARQTFSSATLLGGFHDVTYAYRFGPPSHDVAIATLFDSQRATLSEAFYFVESRDPGYLATAQVTAEAESLADGDYQVTIRSDRFLRNVNFDAPGLLPEDNYFHLTPARPKVVRLSPRQNGTRFKATISALNLPGPVAVRLQSPTR
jgi:beta-mannosidase